MQSYEEYTEQPKYKLCFFAYNAVRYTVGWDAARSLDSGISSIPPQLAIRSGLVVMTPSMASVCGMHGATYAKPQNRMP